MTRFLSVTAVLALSASLLADTGPLQAASTAAEGYAEAMDAMMQGMMKKGTGKPDLDFVSGMIPHHEGAVAMAKVEKQFGKDAAMLKLADAIIAAQENEIGTMKGWLAQKKLEEATPSATAAKASASAMNAMMAHMMVKTTGNADVDFAKGMIPHHQGAIDMANVVLKYGADADVKSMAGNVVKSQGEEITQMKAWLAGHSD